MTSTTIHRTNPLLGRAAVLAAASAALLAVEARADCTPTEGWTLYPSAYLDLADQAFEWRCGAAANGRLHAEVRGYWHDGQDYHAEYRIITLDLSNPNAPGVLGLAPVTEEPTLGWEIAAVGTTLVDVVFNGGLHFFSMADPNLPVDLGWLDLEGQEQEAIAKDGLLFVRTVSPNRLYVVDPADPQNPIVLGSISMALSAVGEPINGIMPYAKGYFPTTIGLIDVSDPANMAVIGSTQHEVSGSTESVALVGHTIVLPNASNTLALFDASDPANITALTFPNDPAGSDGPEEYAVSGLLAYGADEFGGFHVLDLTDPAVPLFTSLPDLTFLDDAQHVVLDGGTVFYHGYERAQLVGVGGCAVLPTIDYSPASRVIDEGAVPTTLEVIATAAVTWQWYKDGVALEDDETNSGATTAALTVNAVLEATGSYTCRVDSGHGTATSAPTVVAVRAGLDTCAGDVTNDGAIDFTDLVTLLANWGVCP